MAFSRLLQAWKNLVIVLRWIRLVLDLLQCYAYFKLSPFPSEMGRSQTARQHDTTVVSMTMGTEPQFEAVVRLWLKQNPGAVVIVTIQENMETVLSMKERVKDDRIVVKCVPKASARHQQSLGLRSVKTKFFVVADDRSHWSPQSLERVLAPFDNPSIGGVTTSQDVRPGTGKNHTTWEIFGRLNLQRRNVQHSALTYFHDGQVLNLSGRFSAYRTCIFDDDRFHEALLSERWAAKHRITTGDDNFFTTWILQRGWKTWFENPQNAKLMASVCPNHLYLWQLLRWSRDTLRYYLIDIQFSFGHRGRRHVIRSLLNMFTYFVTDISMCLEVGYLCFLSFVAVNWRRWPKEALIRYFLVQLGEHWIVSTILTVLEHFPFFSTWSQIQHIPAAILYLYVRCCVVFYGLFTLHRSEWGSRAIDGFSTKRDE